MKLAVALTSCAIVAGCAPGMEEDHSDLGTTPLGQIVSEMWAGSLGEDDLANLESWTGEQFRLRGRFPQTAEMLGMGCDRGEFPCVYNGEVRHRALLIVPGIGVSWPDRDVQNGEWQQWRVRVITPDGANIQATQDPS